MSGGRSLGYDVFMIAYSDYRGHPGQHVAIDGKLVPLKAGAPILAENAMQLAVGGVKQSPRRTPGRSLSGTRAHSSIA
jgi:hypothetical protein